MFVGKPRWRRVGGAFSVGMKKNVSFIALKTDYRHKSYAELV